MPKTNKRAKTNDEIRQQKRVCERKRRARIQKSLKIVRTNHEKVILIIRNREKT